MRVPLRWLQEYCTPRLDVHALAERLAMTGTDVERIERFGVTALEHFVVGKVLDARRHPDADRLAVCMVDIGDGSPSQIVCGAPNVAAGQTVAVAKPGAVIAGGVRLSATDLRGIRSNGMILAEDELAIGTSHEGILVLDEDGYAPGTPLNEVLPIADDVLVLEITPNRPDCLGVYGVAREAHAATSSALSEPPWATDPGSGGDLEGAAVIVDCPELCPRFTARVFDRVTIAPSPPWLKARLMAAGQRPISNVVDITNYVMLLTGQPLHAFDLDRVAGARLVIRRADPGEHVQTLDGQLRTLDREMVLIADGDGPTSIAGLMGGARSEVAEGTTRVLMEVATWNGANIHRTSLALGLRSEASTRFEKQLQPEQPMEAQALATRLMIELCGARARPGTIDVGGPGPPPATIRLRDARLNGLLGTEIPRARSREILRALEFETADAADGLDVKPPPFRRDDVIREADVIEEVARLGGLEQLPSTIPPVHRAAEATLAGGSDRSGPGRLTCRQLLRRRAADALAVQGFDQVISFSFSSPELIAKLRLDRRDVIRLENPLSGELSELRTTLLGSLLDALRHNRAHGAGSLRLFEAGAVYLPRRGGALPDEPHHIGALLIGAVRPPTWREPDPLRADFFAAKGALKGLMDSLRTAWSLEPTPDFPFLHPGRGASIVLDSGRIGWVGELHPLVLAEWDLEETVAGFELDLDAVPEPAPPQYQEIPAFPEVREDLAVVVTADLPAHKVIETVLSAGRPLLASAEVFDVYRDPDRVGEGNVSLALKLTFRAADRTLTDQEVATQREAIATALRDRLSGRVRASS